MTPFTVDNLKPAEGDVATLELRGPLYTNSDPSLNVMRFDGVSDVVAKMRSHTFADDAPPSTIGGLEFKLIAV